MTKYVARVVLKAVPEPQEWSFSSKDARAEFLIQLRHFEPTADVSIDEIEEEDQFDDISGGIL